MFYSGGFFQKPKYTKPIDDLLFDQRSGKLLTFDEKKRIKEYSEKTKKEK